jgi:flagellar hook-basal body complex protein FliE
MTVLPIVPVPPMPGLELGALPDAVAPGANTATPGFGQMVTQGLDAVNQELTISETDLQQLAIGGAQNLHQIMIRLEQSRLSFQLLMQVRSRLLESYDDIMKLQI